MNSPGRSTPLAATYAALGALTSPPPFFSSLNDTFPSPIHPYSALSALPGVLCLHTLTRTYLLVTDHFSSPGKAIGRVCVTVSK